MSWHKNILTDKKKRCTILCPKRMFRAFFLCPSLQGTQCFSIWPRPHPAYHLLTLYFLLQLFCQAYSYLSAWTRTLSCDPAVFLNSLFIIDEFWLNKTLENLNHLRNLEINISFFASVSFLQPLNWLWLSFCILILCYDHL